MTSLSDIRSTFLEFFGSEGHEIVASSPLVPQNDPTLLFTNAGMVQFKNVFTGLEQRPYSRAVTSQKCLRAGGKHNDLDNVGYTSRHHTFFEMLGNFSFGDYFKEEAIDFAWRLMMREFALPPERLLVTVYSGDDQAHDLWRKVAGIPESRIIRIPTHDNFWSMGDTGPCGPCSEIFYDHGDHIPGGPPGSPDEDGDRFIEIWNLVFMQFEQIDTDNRVDLPRPSIDTGMGLERIGALLQGRHDNYDTDLLRALIEASAQTSNSGPDGPHQVSHRVIADHLRASCFLMADGVLPSNEGRGYVLRRIMRRAMRHAQLIGVDEPLMWKLVPTLEREMGHAFPELGRAEALMTETLKFEESKFRRTLDKGLHLLEAEVDKLGEGGTLAGDVAFRLYDTYGFPLDLTRDALRSKGLDVDTDGFNTAMERQRQEARKAMFRSGGMATEAVWFEIRDDVGASEFLGYETEHAEGRVTALVRDGKRVDAAGTGEDILVILNQTPFYGESGGQVGDTGTMLGNGVSLTIAKTTRSAGDLHVHHARVNDGTLAVGDALELRVDSTSRTAIRANHSAAHILHEALRRVLGSHVTQKGSLVTPDRLRFDFSHHKAMSAEEIAEVEAIANNIIRQNEDVVTRLMTPEDAIEAGALALFGEKYGEEVRVLSMGHDAGGGDIYSTELCGGTHVRRTGDIGLVKISSESANASGVRRVEALTGEAALSYLNNQDRIAGDAAAALKTTVQELPGRIATLVEERRKLERELTEAKKKLAMGGGDAAAPDETREIGGVKLVARVLNGISPRDLAGLIDETKIRLGSGVAAFVAINDGKAALAVGVTDDLSGRLNAVDLVRAGAEAVGGKGGGGRADLARAGGPDGSRADAALRAIRAELEGAARAA